MRRSAARLRRGALLIRGPLQKRGPGSAKRHFVPHRVRETDRDEAYYSYFFSIAAVSAPISAAMS
jgi:hypothetical protein